MKVSENLLKWAMRLYPPMLFQRIWVKKIYKGFLGADIKINRSIFTTNFGNSIFGGTIFSATDPFYALLFGQLMKRKGLKVTVWLKSANIQYLKPGRTDLYYTIKISDQKITEAENILLQEGKFIQSFPIEIFDTNGILCAKAINEVYIRNIEFPRAEINQP